MMGRLFISMGALAVAACATPPATPQAPAQAAAPATLLGTRWVGVVAGSPDPRTLPRLEFVTPERVTGFTGCNLLNGGWSTEGAEIRVGPLAMTKRACAGPEGDVESRVVKALGGRVTREGDRLVFTAPSGERFEFTPAQAS